MAIWNVTRVVIANIEADTAERAEDMLGASLTARGYTVHESADTGTNLDAFEAEPDTVADRLP